jgi:hypothetical protein
MKLHSFAFSIWIGAVLLASSGAARGQDTPQTPPADAKPANVAGTWSVSFETPNGTMTQTLTLTQDGSALTGTIGGERGTAEVKGSVGGNNVSFSATHKGQRGTFTVNYGGTVDGDTIKGTISGSGGHGGNGSGGGNGAGGGHGGHGGGVGHGNRTFTAVRRNQ